MAVRLTAAESGGADTVTVEMLLCYAARWTRVALWPSLASDWPRIIAPTAAAVMGLWCDVAESADLADRPLLASTGTP